MRNARSWLGPGRLESRRSRLRVGGAFTRDPHFRVLIHSPGGGVCACSVRAPILRSCGMCPKDNIRILSFGSSRRCRDVYLSRYRFLRLLILGFCTYPWALKVCVYEAIEFQQNGETRMRSIHNARSLLGASHFKRPCSFAPPHPPIPLFHSRIFPGAWVFDSLTSHPFGLQLPFVILVS